MDLSHKSAVDIADRKKQSALSACAGGVRIGRTCDTGIYLWICSYARLLRRRHPDGSGILFFPEQELEEPLMPVSVSVSSECEIPGRLLLCCSGIWLRNGNYAAGIRVIGTDSHLALSGTAGLS